MAFSMPNSLASVGHTYHIIPLLISELNLALTSILETHLLIERYKPTVRKQCNPDQQLRPLTFFGRMT